VSHLIDGCAQDCRLGYRSRQLFIAAMLVTLFVVFYVALVVTGAYDAARIIGFVSGLAVFYWLFNFKLKT
jgi:hypothetical protein